MLDFEKHSYGSPKSLLNYKIHFSGSAKILQFSLSCLFCFLIVCLGFQNILQCHARRQRQRKVTLILTASFIWPSAESPPWSGSQLLGVRVEAPGKCLSRSRSALQSFQNASWRSSMPQWNSRMTGQSDKNEFEVSTPCCTDSKPPGSMNVAGGAATADLYAPKPPRLIGIHGVIIK